MSLFGNSRINSKINNDGDVEWITPSCTIPTSVDLGLRHEHCNRDNACAKPLIDRIASGTIGCLVSLICDQEPENLALENLLGWQEICRSEMTRTSARLAGIEGC